jgi:3-hydroxyisobutyrate dehydrogenase-like beta-hydroxyacid dehydrogenase|tara:strand:+ start:184 stop:1053 length:870 start_codon:yes stop_codon:yes gene_type:complete
MNMGRPVVGMVGLGVMGSAMNTHILAAGHEVIGFDTDPDRLAAFAGTHAGSTAEVASRADMVLLSLPTIDSLDSVAAEVASAGRDGLVAVEMGTFPLEAKERAQATMASAGITLLDAPVSGTGLQAVDATLVVYASGDSEAFTIAEPILNLVGQRTYYLGEFGNGSLMKFVANLLVAVHTLATAEAHRLGAASGLDPDVIQEVIEAGVGSSRIFGIRGPMMAAGTFEPPSARMAILLKDATIIADHAVSTGAPTPLLDTALEWYRAGVADGLGEFDAAALLTLLEANPR